MKRKNKIVPYIRVGTKEQVQGYDVDFMAEIEKHIAPNREQLIKMVQDALDKKSKRLYASFLLPFLHRY